MHPKPCYLKGSLLRNVVWFVLNVDLYEHRIDFACIIFNNEIEMLCYYEKTPYGLSSYKTDFFLTSLFTVTL